MTAMDRLVSERQFHDQQAGQRARTFAAEPKGLFFHDDTYLDHETWIRPAFDQLGDVTGLSMLDFGCGHGMSAVVMARRGAVVTAFDLSWGYLDEARRRASANQVQVRLVQANGEFLPFADGAFDRVWGNAVLHHLDLERAGRELRRVLKPGGWAVFCEPWGENPILNVVRRRIPYPGKQRTADERPLHRRDLEQLRRHFPDLQIRGYQFVSMARRVLHAGRLTAGLDWCDQMLLRRIPVLERFCRYVVVTLRR